MKLIDNWAILAPRLTSVQLAALTAFLSALQLALPAIIGALGSGSTPELIRALMPVFASVLTPDVLPWLTLVTAALTIWARLTKQPALAAALASALVAVEQTTTTDTKETP